MSGPSSCPSCGAAVEPAARFCSACGAQLSVRAAEERKLVTILFADVSGSTEIGEQLDPERLRALLRDYFAAMSRVVAEWDGTLEKYIGDAILAVWGVPAAREDDPIRALNAAREMAAELVRINPQLEARHGVRLTARIGVNTGEVIAPSGGAVGQFLVSGDAVNVAARLEQAAEPGSVLVGERTWASARHAFDFGPPTVLRVKGKREPISARTLGEPAATDAQRMLFGAPMVGRDHELATLRGLLDEAIEGRLPRLVIVSGPAGIGKSRLLRELIRVAGDGVDELLVLRGRCLPAGRGVSFWALGEILRAACSISLDEPAESAAHKLDSLRRPLAAVGLSEDELALSLAALATSANLPIAHDPLEGLDPEAVFAQMSLAWPRLLTGLAATRPLVVMVEDIHWADDSLLDMLELLGSRSQGPVLLVATTRPDFIATHPGFGGGQGASVVGLRPLTDAQSTRLIDELLESAELPAALVNEMRAKAEGNPFFLEEMIQRLVDEGALVMRNGHWQATERAGEVRLSDTVHGLLAARIDALPPLEKQFLQEASVVGRTFWPGALAGAPSSKGASGAAEILLSLERRGLVAARPTSSIEDEPEFLFRHVLIHDVAYASVPKARRARAHAEIGRWIQDLAGDRIEEFGELIAYHYRAAVTADDADLAWADDIVERDEIRRRALEMLIRSGASARHRFAVDRALELHRAGAVSRAARFRPGTRPGGAR